MARHGNASHHRSDQAGGSLDARRAGRRLVLTLAVALDQCTRGPSITAMVLTQFFRLERPARTASPAAAPDRSSQRPDRPRAGAGRESATMRGHDPRPLPPGRLPARRRPPPSSPSASRASCWTAPCSIRWAAARPATAACWCWPTAAQLAIADTRKGKDAEGQPTGDIAHVPAPGPGGAAGAACRPATPVTARIDWERRHRLMRFHTTTHLLCHLVPQLVNGCSITPDYARLDFNMTDPLDKDALTAGIARLVAAAPPGRGRRDQRRGTRRQPGAGQEHVGAAAARHGTRPHHPHRRPTRRSTSSPAAARTWPTPPRSARWSSPRSRRRAPPPDGWCWASPDRPELRTPAAELRPMRDELPPPARRRSSCWPPLPLAVAAQAQVGPTAVVTTDRGARRAAGARARRRRARQAGLGRPAARAPAGVAHLLEELRAIPACRPQLHWTLPAGVTAGDIAWPVPRKIPIGTLANYGYEGTVLLPVPLTITPDFKPSLLGSDLEVKLKANWLVCRKECIPEEGELRAEAAGAQHHGAATARAFEAALAAQPQPVLPAPPACRQHGAHRRQRAGAHACRACRRRCAARRWSSSPRPPR